MTNFAVPFALTTTGLIQTTTDPNQISGDRMESLIGTYPGERVMIPDYGVNIPSYLFSSNFDQEQDILSLQVQQAIADWEPSLTLNSVSVTSIEQEPGVSQIDIQYSLVSNSQTSTTNTATLLIGGTVIG